TFLYPFIFFFLRRPRPPTSTLFPYTTLFRSFRRRAAFARLDGQEGRRMGRARGAQLSVEPRRKWSRVPGDHVLRRGAGTAQQREARRGVGAEAPRLRLRSASAAPRAKTRRHNRHGDDREAGRLGPSRQFITGSAPGRRPIRAHRAQVVLLGSDERRL